MAEEINRKPKVIHNHWISLLCALFGMGSWLPINAIFSQLPVFVQFVPEGWTLPSYTSLLVQSANVAPFLYYIFYQKFAQRQSVLICSFLILGTVSMFCLAFTYHIQYLILGAIHSLYFLIFTFFLSLVGCISSVLFLPFMNKLPELYLFPYFIGEGLSGLIPSAIALIQGVGGAPKCLNISTIDGIRPQKVNAEPRFSSTLFLLIIGCFMLFSTCSFFYLSYVSKFIQPSAADTESKKGRRHNSRTGAAVTEFSKLLFAALLLAQTLINCFSNGILPSIQSYSCLPYGREAYHWSININQIANPIVIYVASFLPILSIRALIACGLLEMICIIYEIMSAVESPTPPFVGSTAGIVFIVFIWMLGTGLISYMKLSIAAIFRRKHQKGLINYGLVTQVGSAVGSVISFILVNYLKLFQPVAETTC